VLTGPDQVPVAAPASVTSDTRMRG